MRHGTTTAGALRIVTMTCLAAALSASAASAQGMTTGRAEVGGYLSTIPLASAGRYHAVKGFGGWFAVDLTNRLTVEARTAWFPTNELPLFQTQGGRTWQLSGVARGRFLRRNRYAIYGMASAGVIGFSNAVTRSFNDDVDFGRVTHTSLDSGFGLEFLPSGRWVARAEFTGPLYEAPGGQLGRSAPNAQGAVLVASTPATFEHPWQFTAGIGYRLGRPRSIGPERHITTKWDVGGQFAFRRSTDLFLSDIAFRNDPGVGGFSSYRLWEYMFADGALLVFPKNRNYHTPYDGGRGFAVLGGVKLGIRRDRVGFFAKVRPGAIVYSEAITGFDESRLSGTYGRSASFVWDTGAVLEIYNGPHMLVRADVGDLVGDRGRPAHSFNALLGLGWRFF